MIMGSSCYLYPRNIHFGKIKHEIIGLDKAIGRGTMGKWSKMGSSGSPKSVKTWTP